MGQKLFEVFLGTYNAEPWIDNLINSLESQDAEPFQVRIFDNSSSDKTVDIIKQKLTTSKLKNQYELIVNESNIGPISTFKDRLNLFQSKWILMIHQDDVYHSNHISTLQQAMKDADDNVGVIFTAMQRVNAENKELLTPPTLAPLISEDDRFKNVLLNLQLQAINFPACAIRKNKIAAVETSYHTTAFNDSELLLRILSTSNVQYIPQETVHYRIHRGNAASQTASEAGDIAVSIGMIEFFHGDEFKELVNLNKSDVQITDLITAIKTGIEIRINDLNIQNFTRIVIAEKLIRILGYQNEEVNKFLIESYKIENIPINEQIINNLNSKNNFNKHELLKDKMSSNEFNSTSNHELKIDKSLLSNLENKISLKHREKIYLFLFNTWLTKIYKRPFLKVWQNMQKARKK